MKSTPPKVKKVIIEEKIEEKPKEPEPIIVLEKEQNIEKSIDIEDDFEDNKTYQIKIDEVLIIDEEEENRNIPKKIIDDNDDDEEKKVQKKSLDEVVIDEIVVDEQGESEENKKDKNSWVETRIGKGIDIYQLAQKYYGNTQEYQRIYNANKALIGKDLKLKEGTSLKIPITKDFKDQPEFLNIQ